MKKPQNVEIKMKEPRFILGQSPQVWVPCAPLSEVLLKRRDNQELLLLLLLLSKLGIEHASCVFHFQDTISEPSRV